MTVKDPYFQSPNIDNLFASEFRPTIMTKHKFKPKKHQKNKEGSSDDDDDDLPPLSMKKAPSV
jgi:hypothetical protein